MRKSGFIAALLMAFLAYGTVFAAQKTRYFKAEHGVGATYLRLGTDGQYSVMDREHVGVFLADEGHWQQTGTVITFTPKDAKNSRIRLPRTRTTGRITWQSQLPMPAQVLSYLRKI